MKRLVAGSDGVKVGAPIIVPLPNPTRDAREVIIARLPTGELRAYLNMCRHLPVPLDFGSGRLTLPDPVHVLCKTHGALFSFADGMCVAGPCRGRPLVAVPVTEGGGDIFIDI